MNPSIKLSVKLSVKLIAALVLALVLSAAPALAAPPPLEQLHPLLSPADADAATLARQSAYFHFMSRYAVVISLGVATGGVMMYRVVGSATGAIFGSWLGAMITEWLFMNSESDHVMVRTTW